MFSLFGFGFLLGMQHALEADHIAAVACLTSGETSSKQAMAQGGAWGIGHSLSLLLFGGTVLLFGSQVNVQIAQWLEFAVGIMLVFLGAKVLCSLWRERIHAHIHNHPDGTVHIHAHSHKNDPGTHDRVKRHDHVHNRTINRSCFQALSVGIMHGMAGSAVLVMIAAVTASDSVVQGIAYIFLFGLGSVLGMAVLSGAIVLPASYAIRNLPYLLSAIRCATGVGTFILGGYVMMDSWV